MANRSREAEATLPSATDNEENEAIGRSALRKATWRLIPILAIGYGLAYMDRISVSFAALRMNEDLHFTATIYGIGAGLFFVGNALAEVPSNLLLLRFGAKRILATIVFVWGLAATAMMLVRTPSVFAAPAAGRRRSRLLSRRALLSDSLVPGRYARPRRQPLLYRAAAQFGGDGIVGRLVDGLGRPLGPARLAVALPR
jgi:MFS family permease